MTNYQYFTNISDAQKDGFTNTIIDLSVYCNWFFPNGEQVGFPFYKSASDYEKVLRLNASLEAQYQRHLGFTPNFDRNNRTFWK